MLPLDVAADLEDIAVALAAMGYREAAMFVGIAASSVLDSAGDEPAQGLPRVN